MSNYPFDAQNACSNKTRKTVPLKVCTLTTHIVRLRACCFTSATTMDQWSIWWSSCTTSHAHSLLYIHLEPQLTLESLNPSRAPVGISHMAQTRGENRPKILNLGCIWVTKGPCGLGACPGCVSGSGGVLCRIQMAFFR